MMSADHSTFPLLIPPALQVGLVLPPAIAPIQVVFLPIHTKKTSPEMVALLTQRLLSLSFALEEAGIRCHFDDRPHLRVGARYYEWERRGVPLRVALGERDLISVSGPEVTLSVFDRVAYAETRWSLGNDTEATAAFVSRVRSHLSVMQQELLLRAERRLSSQLFRVSSYEEMKRGLVESPGLYLVPWRESSENEQRIKEDCKATIRCYPLEENSRAMDEGQRCFFSGDQATHWALFARAY
jgi:prolyl-tRNA synthetase